MLLARLPRLGLLDQRIGQDVELAMRSLELAVEQAKPFDQRADMGNRGLGCRGSDRELSISAEVGPGIMVQWRPTRAVE
jgi:hypothetical protein